MSDVEKILIKNLKEYFSEAERTFKEGKYNTAVTLYFKCLVELCDLVLWRKTRRIGISHSLRFRMLERKIPYLYRIADSIFSYYRNTYSKIIPKEHAKEVRENVIKSIKKFGIKV